MKKIIVLVALTFTTLQAPAQHRRERFGSETRVGFAIGGAAFILASALETPERVWVSSPSQNTNSYGKPGYWRQQKFYENPNKVACLLTGLTLAICSISIKF